MMNSPMIDVIPNLVSQEDNDLLTKIPDQEEIKKTVFSMDPDSAPGPDGFQGSFYRFCGDIISSEEAIISFFKEGRLLKSLNAHFLCLIPKIEQASTVDHYRPICMSHFFLQII